MKKKNISLYSLIFLILCVSSVAAQTGDYFYEIQLYDREFNYKRDKYYFNKKDYDTLKKFRQISGLGFSCQTRGSGDPVVEFKNLAFFHFLGRNYTCGDTQFVVASDYNCCAKLMPNDNSAEFFDVFNSLMKKHPLITPLFNRIDNVDKYIGYISFFNSTIAPSPHFARKRFEYLPQDKKIQINYDYHQKLLIENAGMDDYLDFTKAWQQKKIHFYPPKNKNNQNKLEKTDFVEYEYSTWGKGWKTVERIKLHIFYNGEIYVKEKKTIFTLKKHHHINDRYL